MFIEIKTAHNFHFNSFRQMLCTHKNFNWTGCYRSVLPFHDLWNAMIVSVLLQKNELNALSFGSIDSNSNFVSTSSLFHDEIISDNFIIYVINNFFSIFSLFRKYMYIYLCVCFFLVGFYLPRFMIFFLPRFSIFLTFFFYIFFFYIFRHFW